jgi:hypothetical protein
MAKMWTDEVLKNVFALLLDGYSYREIAEMYGVTLCAVRNRVNQTWVGPTFRERRGITKMKPVFFWTKERKDQVRRLYWSGMSAAQIAEVMGIAHHSAKAIITKMGIGDRVEGAKKASACRIGTKHTPEALAKMSEKAKARFQRPEYREKWMKSHTPEIMRERNRQQADKRRGFSVPAHHEEAYRHLTQKKGFKAREAAETLQIIPRSTNMGA